MSKSLGAKAAKIALAAVGAAAVGTVCTGVVQFAKWAKDPYSTELWFGFLKKGVRITKGEEPHSYRVQTGYRWHDDDAEDDFGSREVTEMEIELPPEPLPEETAAEEPAAPEAAEAETAASETGNEA